VNIDPANPVVALCAAGMAIEGDADAARRLFEQAWAARTDDYDASIAAHFVARHQTTVDARIHWNRIAAQHAELVTDGRTREFMASLYLNLADALREAGNIESATAALATSRASLGALPEGGYRSFIALGVARLEDRLAGNNAGS
jgi:hypothetical protein